MNIDSHHCAFYDIPVLYGLIPLLKKYKFESVRYIGNSFFNGSKWQAILRHPVEEKNESAAPSSYRLFQQCGHL